MPRLLPLTDGLWHAEDELRAPGGVRFPVRMTVVRAPSGVLLWSPIAIDDDLAAELRELGPVIAICAPNLLHHLFVKRAKTRFPEARLLAAPGLDRKRADIPWDAELAPGVDLGPGLSVHGVGGVPPMNEQVLHHAPSRTLVVTDLVFNVREAPNFLTWFVFRVVAGTLGRLGQSRLVRFATKDRAAYNRTVSALLALDFDRLVLAHGPVLETGGREALLDALGPSVAPPADTFPSGPAPAP